MDTTDFDDIFLSDIDSQYRSLNINDFQMLAIEIINNEDIKDGTALCFQVFYRCMSRSIREKTFEGQYTELPTILSCILHLRKVLKFNSSLFFSYLTEEFLTLPIEILWWLHKHNITNFVHYCCFSKYMTLSASLLRYIEAKKQHSIFVYDRIVPDLIAELLRHAYTPPSLFHLHYRVEWESFCSKVLYDMVDSILSAVFLDSSCSYLNVFNHVQNLDRQLPRVVVKDFFRTALKKLMVYNVDEFDIYAAYTYQELWKSSRLSRNLFTFLSEVFRKFCTLHDIMDIMEDCDEKVNWRYTLAAVAVSTNESGSGGEHAKDVTSTLLQQYFKRPKPLNLVKCLLFARQIYMEEKAKIDYSAWYSTTFGSRSNFKRKCSETKFKLLMSTLIELVQYESKDYLKVQHSLSLDAPLMCNYLIHNYKSLCRARLQELDKSPSVNYRLDFSVRGAVDRKGWLFCGGYWV
ncbi:uncharacterized protein LOC116165540 isoform X2 [Photinus pyralis]|uniref:uncharacterized protein LOC116165540 isoform X2 n=1 Tax=Photinus pyralis TaxID=7054 RepID=UPI0012672002|nr:uncharacterized protein LOC116165540 isoform X2 [Photinus pyralis]